MTINIENMAQEIFKEYNTQIEDDNANDSGASTENAFNVASKSLIKDFAKVTEGIQ
ncbi:MAG: hypothetical protein LBI42_14865 [Chitinispirillales bacterium]|jgi:cation transport regulator ChaB|nr:hypothetical protein [Chitinispirillales bacterium]